MNLKEFFDIEPVQKNGILILIFVFIISYLQLYLFKNCFNSLDKFDKIILSLAVSIFWIVSEIPTYFFFMNSKWLKWKNKGIEFKYVADKIVGSFGFTIIFWMVLITYIGFEFRINLKEFIRLSLIIMFSKSLFWLIYWLKYNYNITKQSNKED